MLYNAEDSSEYPNQPIKITYTNSVMLVALMPDFHISKKQNKKMNHI